jgi:transmembrane sensor
VQKPYNSFTAAEFACDDAFLAHYLAPTPQSDQFWTVWLQDHHEQEAQWLLGRQLLEAVQTGLSDYARTYLTPEAEARLLARIRATNSEQAEPVRIHSFQNHRWAYWAAAACLLLAGYWGIRRFAVAPPSLYQQQIAKLQKTNTERINQTTKPELVRLPDGSSVILAPQSRLLYPSDYGQQNRSVYLLGEATFDVAKDPQKPFFVYANEVVTKVLGTKFVVRSFERDKQVLVQVQHGQVSVYKGEPVTSQQPTAKTLQGVLLLPNQQVVFSRETETFAKSLVQAPQRVDVDQAIPISFVFDETPVKTVFQRLEKAYGINIVYNEDQLSACQLTASLTDETLFQKLDIIVQSIDASYEVVDGQVLISGKGCSAN